MPTDKAAGQASGTKTSSDPAALVDLLIELAKQSSESEFPRVGLEVVQPRWRDVAEARVVVSARLASLEGQRNGGEISIEQYKQAIAPLVAVQALLSPPRKPVSVRAIAIVLGLLIGVGALYSAFGPDSEFVKQCRANGVDRCACKCLETGGVRNALLLTPKKVAIIQTAVRLWVVSGAKGKAPRWLPYPMSYADCINSCR